jgi:hypothetical protein
MPQQVVVPRQVVVPQVIVMARQVVVSQVIGVPKSLCPGKPSCLLSVMARRSPGQLSRQGIAQSSNDYLFFLYRNNKRTAGPQSRRRIPTTEAQRHREGQHITIPNPPARTRISAPLRLCGENRGLSNSGAVPYCRQADHREKQTAKHSSSPHHTHPQTITHGRKTPSLSSSHPGALPTFVYTYVSQPVGQPPHAPPDSRLVISTTSCPRSVSNPTCCQPSRAYSGAAVQV